MASNAEEFFNRIFSSDNPYSFLEKLITIQQTENDWLDFKGAERIEDKNVIELWSKALSGFANTEGGVLIWGIDARKNDDGIDCASGLSLVPNADQFAQRLKDVILDAVVAPVKGVKVESVKKPNDEKGFVVCLIPEGTSKAHRAERADKQFYLRIADKFSVPAVAVIRQLFHPQSSANIVPKVKFIFNSGENTTHFRFSLENTGTLTATDLVVEFSHNITEGASIHHTPANVKVALKRNALSYLLGIGPNLHPGSNMNTAFEMIARNAWSLTGGLTFEVQTYCTNTVSKAWRCTITSENHEMNKDYTFSEV